MLTERANAICLLRILEEYSDAEHILSMREISAKLKTVFGLHIDRRTVYCAIDLLISLGYDISTYAENGKGYYLRERMFETSEVQLLTDAVYSFPYISEIQTKQLVGKLQGLLSKHQRQQYRHLKPMHYNKTQNQSTFLNIELIEEAISRQVQISFDYMEYRLDKELHFRREEKYVVEPYAMVCTNEHYYLICRYVGYDSVSFYRIDLMQNIAVSTIPAEHGKDDMQQLSQRAVYAFTGKEELIKLRCKNYSIGDVLERFGTEICVTEDGAERFIATFMAVPIGIKFWALQYLPHTEVLEPMWLRQEIMACLKKNPYETENLKGLHAYID